MPASHARGHMVSRTGAHGVVAKTTSCTRVHRSCVGAHDPVAFVQILLFSSLFECSSVLT